MRCSIQKSNFSSGIFKIPKEEELKHKIEDVAVTISNTRTVIIKHVNDIDNYKSIAKIPNDFQSVKCPECGGFSLMEKFYTHHVNNCKGVYVGNCIGMRSDSWEYLNMKTMPRWKLSKEGTESIKENSNKLTTEKTPISKRVRKQLDEMNEEELESLDLEELLFWCKERQ